jgi:flagellar motor switch protein FliN/FliY
VLVVADSLGLGTGEHPFGAQELLAASARPRRRRPPSSSRGAARSEAAHEVQGHRARPASATAGCLAAVPLHSGGEHVATLALCRPPASPPRAAPPAAAERSPAHARFQALERSARAAPRPLDLLHDVEMGVTAELGRTRMTVRDLLSLTPGAVVELDRAAGSPVDVLVNGTLIARGEVVVIDEEFGIRISEIIGTRTLDAATRR